MSSRLSSELSSFDNCAAAGKPPAGKRSFRFEPLDPQKIAVPDFRRSPAVCSLRCPSETFADAQVVHHRAQRMVPNWSPSRRRRITLEAPEHIASERPPTNCPGNVVHCLSWPDVVVSARLRPPRHPGDAFERPLWRTPHTPSPSGREMQRVPDNSALEEDGDHPGRVGGIEADAGHARPRRTKADRDRAGPLSSTIPTGTVS